MGFFTKKFRTFDPHLPIVWDKVLKKTFFFDTFPYSTTALYPSEKVFLQAPSQQVTNSRYTVTFGKPSTIPVVGLASYPSSGNTWLRYLIRIFWCHIDFFNNHLLKISNALPIQGTFLRGWRDTTQGACTTTSPCARRVSTGRGCLPMRGSWSQWRPTVILQGKGLTRTGQLRYRLPKNSIQQLAQNYLSPMNHKSSFHIQIAFNHHAEVNHSAILLIRNPYEAIIGHRNLDR